MKLLLCVALSAAAVWAQSPRQEWTSVNALTAGAEIRVSLTNGKTVRGFFQRATAEAIVVSASKSEEMLAQKDVKRVQLKKPGHRGRNTLIGFGVGAAGGLTAGAVVDANDRDFLPNAGKVVLGGLGAIIGTVIGVAWPTGGWRDIYRAL